MAWFSRSRERVGASISASEPIDATPAQISTEQQLKNTADDHELFDDNSTGEIKPFQAENNDVSVIIADAVQVPQGESSQETIASETDESGLALDSRPNDGSFQSLINKGLSSDLTGALDRLGFLKIRKFNFFECWGPAELNGTFNKSDISPADAESQYQRGFDLNQKHTPESCKAAVKWWYLAAEQGHKNAADRFSRSLAWYKKLSEEGDPEALFVIGRAYCKGIGFSENQSEAERLLLLAAKQGHQQAQISLGDICCSRHGMGSAIQWYRLAAEGGSASAMMILGQCYGVGVGISQNHEEAEKWIRLAADRGNACAIESMALLTKIKLLAPLIDQENAASQYKLGGCYAEGIGIAQSYSEAEKWYQLAAVQGHGTAKFALMKLKAEQGNSDAAYELARAYTNADCIERDLTLAETWCGVAAERGHAEARRIILEYKANHGDAEAQYQTGLACATSAGVQMDNEAAVRWYRTAAENGHPEAQAELGIFLFEVSAYDEAAVWLRKASEGGVKRAQVKLANLLMSGFINCNFDEAVRWYKASEEVNAEVEYQFGDYFRDAKNFTEALCWFTKAVEHGHDKARFNLKLTNAEMGDATAQYAIGYCYENGDGVPLDLCQAIEWYRKAARQDATEAQTKLGALLFSGSILSLQDHQEASIWLRKAAEKGDSAAQKILVNLLLVKTDMDSVEEAARWVVASGYLDAEIEYRLGINYRNIQRTSDALAWLSKADTHGHVEAKKELRLLTAKAGDASAQYDLGLAYANGDGLTQDYVEAAKWYRLAAEQGHGGAQCNLGCCYDSGKGVTQDYNEAVKWFRRSADQGGATAQSNLGLCFRYGQGVQKDAVEAIRWFEKASAQGNEAAKTHLVTVRAELAKQAEERMRAEKAARRKMGFDGNFFEDGSQIAEWISALDAAGNSVKWTFAATLGEGPFAVEMMDAILNRQRVTPCYCGDEHAPVLIVGRDGWTEDELDKHIAARSGQSLHIYSQEMAMVALLTGHDPFDAGEEVLLEFGKGHPALEFLMQHAFTWPVVTQGWSGEIFIDGDAWRNKSPLTAMEYHVGHTSALTELARRNVLTKIYKGRLIFPVGFSPAEQKEWGMPGSGTRLEKIATHIARQTSMRINRTEYHVAVREWQSDLDWLKGQFYQKSFRFGWPS